jgi:phospholipid-binding lipoprotein MlaA
VRLPKLAVLLCASLGACTSVPATQSDNDPFEEVNRAVFEINTRLDDHVVVPIARIYLRVVPAGGRDALHNATDNLKVPGTFVNDLLQGNAPRAGQSFYRFCVNSTLGAGGLFDVASSVGHVSGHTEDFGQTLAVYGVGEGAYMVLPVLGPSNVRDTVGYVVDLFSDPLSYVTFSGHRTVLLGVVTLSALGRRSRNLNTVTQAEQSSMDFYAAARSAYRQHRNSEIHNGATTPEDLPDF